MVKYIIYVISVIIIVGCNHQNNLVLIKYDDGVMLINYCDTDIFVHKQITEVASYIQMDEFEVKSITKPLYKQISGNDSVDFINLITDFTNKYYENLMGNDYERKYEYESVDFDSNIYIVGKIILKDSVDSYLLLFEQKDLYYEISGTTSKYYFLLNYKNDLLKSVVNLSTSMNGIDDGVLINSYLIDNLYFSQINFSFSTKDVKTILPVKLYNKKFSEKGTFEFLYYSLFIIDENGFIKFINI